MSTPPPGWPPDSSDPGRPAPPEGRPAPPEGYPGYPAGPGYPADPGYPAAPADPLVATDFSSWFQRVFEVVRARFVPLAIVWGAPSLAFGIYLAAISIITARAAQLPRPPTELGQDPSAAMTAEMTAVFGRMLPVVLEFSVVYLVLNALAQAASFQIAVRGANGQPVPPGYALRLGLPRLLPLLGWSVLAGLITTIGFLLLIVPGIWLSVVLFGSISGVVVVERAGIGRCFRLIRNRFWATAGRMAVAFLISWVYSFIAGLVSGAATIWSPIAGGAVYAVLMLPMLVYFAAVFVVTYAELRRHENPEVSTATLAAELSR